MPQPIQVTQSELRGPMVVQNYVGHAGEVAVASDRDSGSGDDPFELSIDGDDAVNAACLQEPGIFCDEVLPVPVVRCEEEVSLLHQDLRRSAEHQRVIALAEFGKQNADGLRLQALERTRDEAGLIAELLCRGLDPFSRCCRNRTAGRVVQYEGDGGRTQVQMFGQHLQADAAGGRWNRSCLSWHRSQQPV